MSISRANVATYLDEQFSSLAAAVGQNATPATGYKPDIDNALRKLGKTESELATATATDAQRDAVFALGEYYALERFSRLLADRVNHTMGETKLDFTAQLAHVEKLLARAERKLTALGYDVNGSGWTIANMNLDWLEPELEIVDELS